MTTALVVAPCVLLIISLVAAWIVPSLDVNEILHRGDLGTGNDPSAPVSSLDSVDANGKSDFSLAAPTTAKTNGTTAGTASSRIQTMVPRQLLDLGVYDEAADFSNELGITPTGWERSNANPDTWGPCRFKGGESPVLWKDLRRRPPSGSSNSSNDTAPVSTEYYRNADLNDLEFTRGKSFRQSGSPAPPSGFCRPGFLIIGAGKCGTSSLYHYLVGHPRVLPAIEKQIHYFRYRIKLKPLSWYYGHFPTPRSFLEHGGLMSGEASPGYLPYPDVARDIYKTWSGTMDDNGIGDGSLGKPLAGVLASPNYRSMAPSVPPKIIAVGREPFDRIYSSYRYNYVVPTIERMRSKGHPRIPTAKKARNKKNSQESGEYFELNREDDYYTPYLFTLEEFVRAELKQLKGCLHDWGPSETYNKWRRDAVYKQEVALRNGRQRRDNPNGTEGSGVPPPLIDLDGICYGSQVNKTVYRPQWSEMQTANPRKVLLNENLHLTQALIGRSLYVFPLEWWYLNFQNEKETRTGGGASPSKNSTAITFVCTEHLSDLDTMHDLTARLGLPRHDGFDQVLAEGAYNVGGHRGYDRATPWEELLLEEEEDGDNNATTTTNSTEDENSEGSHPKTKEIPLPEDLYQEVKDFIDPYNERLFALTGKRCDW